MAQSSLSLPVPDGMSDRVLHDFPGGLSLPTHKQITNHKPSILHPLPERMFLPLQQHVGVAATPLVKPGDTVLKGQQIARADGYVSVPVHASTSGTITDIGDYPVPHPSGLKAACFVLEPDGEDKLFDIQPVNEYASVDPKLLQEVIRECGIVGLGGAGFPAHVKILEGVENAVDTLIINGVECEPHISCDDRLIQEKATYIVAGAKMIRHAVQATHCVIAVEDDMHEAHACLAALVDDDLELVQVPAHYPAGGEKQLIKVLTGKEVPSGGLPIHAGIVIHNVATAAAVYRAVTRGEPIISRYVTVTGQVDEPINLQVLLGTPVKDCLQTCGYEPGEDKHVFLGGPMMGIQVTDPNIPVIKTTNCILVEKKTVPQPEHPCIRCGDCVPVCPAQLLPQQLYWHTRMGQLDLAQHYHLFDCIECGCCAYVCPSNIPLVQYYRHAKAEIAAEGKRRQRNEAARQHFTTREARLAQQAEAQRPTEADEDKAAYIKAAVARSKAKREANTTTGSGDD
ncbi:MAG: electron transport complex subunit RsxC [Gammaproteobacteria bacterium]